MRHFAGFDELLATNQLRCEQLIKAAIRESEVIDVDETGFRLGGTNAWVHIARTDSLTHLAAHSKRGKAAFEAIGEVEPHRAGWTTALAKLLIDIKESVELAKNNSRTELQNNLQKDFINRFDSLNTQGEDAVRGSPDRKGGGLTAQNLLGRIIRYKKSVLRFMTDFAAPFDNNGSERDLRMLKLQR